VNVRRLSRSWCWGVQPGCFGTICMLSNAFVYFNYIYNVRYVYVF
jgi:hypothetical protein